MSYTMRYTLYFYIIIITSFLVTISFAAENCSTSQKESRVNVLHIVDSKIPNFLKGAKIVITLANGASSTVSAEKFMVVPRRQLSIIGQNKILTETKLCKASDNISKNSIIADVRKDIKELETSRNAIPNGQQAQVRAVKAIIPGISYYRREILSTPLGLGVGIDSNSTVKALLGFDF